MIKWNLEAFNKLNADQLRKGMTRAGVYFTSKLRGYVGKAQPYKRYDGGRRYRGLDPSKPGDFPRKLSGQLQKSMTWELDKKKLILSVGSNLKGYPSYLQTGTRFMLARPWLSLGFDKERNAIGKMILKG